MHHMNENDRHNWQKELINEAMRYFEAIEKEKLKNWMITEIIKMEKKEQKMYIETLNEHFPQNENVIYITHKENAQAMCNITENRFYNIIKSYGFVYNYIELLKIKIGE